MYTKNGKDNADGFTFETSLTYGYKGSPFAGDSPLETADFRGSDGAFSRLLFPEVSFVPVVKCHVKE